MNFCTIPDFQKCDSKASVETWILVQNYHTFQWNGLAIKFKVENLTVRITGVSSS